MLKHIAGVLTGLLLAGGAAVAHQAPSDAPRLTQPVLVKEVKPEYTPAALKARIEGTVTLEIGITVEGVVDQARVKKSLDREHGLDEQALAAVRQWIFEPARRDGKPIPVVVDVSVEFSLDDGKDKKKSQRK